MELSKTSINGSETSGLEGEELALSHFYKAFNTQDIHLMEQSWLKTEEVSMDNPIGGIRRGWQEIFDGYKLIFNGPARVYVEFYDFSIHSTKSMFFATGREKGYCRINETTLELVIRTTRIFKKSRGKWLQIHHHGSIDNPELLKKYQEALIKK